MRFVDLQETTRLDGVTVASADASGDGDSSIGILITGSSGVELVGVEVRGARGELCVLQR